MLTRSKSTEATLSPNEFEPINRSTHNLSAAERLAQLDEEIILETIRIRELELVRLKSNRGPSIPAIFPIEDDNISVLDDLSQHSSKLGFQHSSSTIIKTVEKDLLANILNTSEKSKSFNWLQLVVVYIGHGGRQSPWSFLHSQRRKAFEKFLSTKHGSNITASEYYEDMVYTSADTCIFIKDYIGFIIHENHIKEDDFLDHCVMKETIKFDAPKLRDYILESMSK